MPAALCRWLPPCQDRRIEFGWNPSVLPGKLAPYRSATGRSHQRAHGTSAWVHKAIAADAFSIELAHPALVNEGELAGWCLFYVHVKSKAADSGPVQKPGPLPA